MKIAIQFFVTAIICGMLTANASTPLKINMPETITGLSDAQLEMLKGKISDIVLSHSFENAGEFTISPSFTKGEHNVYEGMQNIHVLS